MIHFQNKVVRLLFYFWWTFENRIVEKQTLMKLLILNKFEFGLHSESLELLIAIS